MTTLMVGAAAADRSLAGEPTGPTAHHLKQPAAQTGAAAPARREQLFATIRLSRALVDVDTTEPGAIVDFPTTIVVDGGIHDLDTTAVPGYFTVGHHMVVAKVRVGALDVSGRFEIGVGDSYGVAPALWTAIDVATGLHTTIPAAIEQLLPKSVQVPAAAATIGSIRRAHLAAERARAELLESNRGLVRSVVNRFRGVVRAESASIDLADLMAVGEHHLLEVVDRWYTDPNTRPVRDVAWSKVVQRGIGNALRAEIARATGVSVEFRQLLAWFHAHPEDRAASPETVAERMAFAAGVTRVMSRLGLHERAAGVAALETMLANGEAAYIAPGRDASTRSRELRARGVFVISPRSSFAEIERAQRFNTAGAVTLEGDDESYERAAQLSMRDTGFDRADDVDVVRRLIEASGMTPLEAMVWLQRTGALDPGGHATELPDIAADLGLRDRAEARAALRRARRKLDAWASGNFSAESLNA